MHTVPVRKGVIVVAGLGTRFLPATKAMPKEMLPVLDKPVVQYIVEEMVASGITEIIFVTSSQKRAIEDHFDHDPEFEAFLQSKGKYDRIKPLVDLTNNVRFFYTRQSEPLGNGHALLCAKEFIGDEPFAFSDGDSIIDTETPVIKQLLEVYQETGASVIGAGRTDNRAALTKYGNLFVEPTDNERLFSMKQFVEKPDIDHVSPHGLFVAGMRYIFTQDIWQHLEDQGMGKDDEIWVADAANELAKTSPFYAYEYDGTYFDTGNKLALLKAAIHFAKKDPAMREEIIAAVSS
jgi:UTP--glucose-1-phosphate uridylyltransferase